MTRRLFAALALCCALVPAHGAGDAAPIVAEIGGQPIRTADLEVPGKSPAEPAAAARARGEALRGRVWRFVFEDYSRTRKVVATEAEIDSQIDGHRRMQARMSTERSSQRAALVAQLAAPGTDEKRRKQAQEQLELLERIAKFDAERAKELEDPKMREIAARSERNVARAWATQWKLNQALFREYGGRIIFQQAGWEPIDAYRKVLEQYEAKKRFVVHDRDLRASVYAYFEHRFVYADEAKARFYFEKPYWERTPEEMRAAGF